MTTDLLFNTLITLTWQSAMLAAAVGIIIALFGRRLQPRFRYLLWCVVLLRLALPILPTMPWTYPQVVLYNTSNPQFPASMPTLAALDEHSVPEPVSFGGVPPTLAALWLGVTLVVLWDCATSSRATGGAVL